MRTSEKTDYIYKAIFEAQQELESIQPLGVGNRGHSYIKIEQWISILIDIGKKHGLIALQNSDVEDGKTIFVSRVIHLGSGQWVEGRKIMTENVDPQKYGGELTYDRRYFLDGWFTRGNDDEDPDSKVYEQRERKLTDVAKRNEELKKKNEEREKERLSRIEKEKEIVGFSTFDEVAHVLRVISTERDFENFAKHYEASSALKSTLTDAQKSEISALTKFTYQRVKNI